MTNSKKQNLNLLSVFLGSLCIVLTIPGCKEDVKAPSINYYSSRAPMRSSLNPPPIPNLTVRKAKESDALRNFHFTSSEGDVHCISYKFTSDSGKEIITSNRSTFTMYSFTGNENEIHAVAAIAQAGGLSEPAKVVSPFLATMASIAAGDDARLFVSSNVGDTSHTIIGRVAVSTYTSQNDYTFGIRVSTEPSSHK